VRVAVAQPSPWDAVPPTGLPRSYGSIRWVASVDRSSAVPKDGTK
jgi:hypothetical protein